MRTPPRIRARRPFPGPWLAECLFHRRTDWQRKPDPGKIGRSMEIGAAKVEIPIAERGIGMMGWVVPENVVEGSQTPLSARAFVLRANGCTLALVCCELAFISIAVKEGVTARLREEHPGFGLDRSNVMLMATHTHSGPGGFTHYPIYNITIPGFVPSVCDAIVDAIVRAIGTAHEDLAPGEMRFATGEFAPDVPVAFNRSIASYNRNPDVEKVDWGSRHLAIDRCMRMLRFDRSDGRCLGALNFFGVHGTSVHSDNRLCHFDNKGYAASLLEAEQGERFVGAFAQGSAGDVTPNFKTHPGRKWVRGMHSDDDASAHFNGELQASKAAEILRTAAENPALSERLAAAHRYADLSDVEVDPAYVNGEAGRRTGPAELGMAMFFGTEEGPGLPRRLVFLQGVVAGLRTAWRLLPRSRAVARRLRQRDEIQGEKVTWMEAGRRRFLGFANLRKLPLPRDASAMLRLVQKLDLSDVAEPKPWSPEILPIQLFVLGPIALAALPQELTTTSGRRIRRALKAELADLGVTDVVALGYANAYAGYVTTPEEYAEQDYEGASTHFGKWTLPAYLTLFKELVAELRSGAPNSDETLPPQFSAADLADRSYSPPAPRPA